ncbi:MAG: RNA pseudouridine synthase [Bacteroidales bacterium]|nr:RNA pseudouridine synthase [Bacteroidales bacterium]
MQILFEDNHLIAVNKRPSEIVQGDRSGDTPLSETVEDYIRRKYSKPGKAFLGVVHRLDRPVSGVVVFARTSKALARMNAQIAAREIRKTYLAVVANAPPQEEGHLIHYIIRDSSKNKSFITHEGRKGAKRAELFYRRIGSIRNYHLLEIDLLTGRHHQIRAQLAHIGCPVRGDLKYGYPRSNPDASIHLHAWKLDFNHPVIKQQVFIMAPTPHETVWEAFKII